MDEWTLPVSQEELRRFIVKAKSSTYAGSGNKVAPWRQGAQELEYKEGEFYYRDSYFGEKHFLGDETVYHAGRVIWAMSYHGHLLSGRVSAAAVGQIIKRALLKTYATGEFLGNFCCSIQEPGPELDKGQLDTTGAPSDQWTYVDGAVGSIARFVGEERIFHNGVLVYRLHYFGGLIE